MENKQLAGGEEERNIMYDFWIRIRKNRFWRLGREGAAGNGKGGLERRGTPYEKDNSSTVGYLEGTRLDRVNHGFGEVLKKDER